MIDYDAFVKSLGPRAKEYTPKQLGQLHRQIVALVDVLLNLRKQGILPFKDRPAKEQELDVF